MCASESTHGTPAWRGPGLARRLVMGVMGMMVALVWTLPVHAQADKEQEQIKRLRLQIRQLQQQQATAQEAQAQADKARAQAERALASARSDAGQNKVAAAQAGRRASALSAELQAAREDNAQLRQQIEQLKSQLQTQQAQAQREQRQSSDELAQARASHEALSARHAQCRADNVALHDLGMQLLDRYENKGVGEALAEQEPFFQMARVRLENTVAQYRDKLDAARFKEPSASVDARP